MGIPTTTPLALSIKDAAGYLGRTERCCHQWLKAAGHSSACQGVCGHELVPGVPVFRVGRATRVGLYPLRAYLGAPREVAS